MKIIHTADIHAGRKNWAETCKSLDVIEQRGREVGVDLFAIAGDLADGPLQNTERDVFDALCGRIQRLADIAPVAIIYGTPSHDAPGSLEVFEKLAAKFSIVILRPGRKYFLADGEIWGKLHQGMVAKAILFGVPEPNKKWLLADAEATGKDASDEAVRGAMRNLLLGLGGMRREHADLPCVLLYHGQVSGARTGTGYEAGSGIAVSRDDLAAAGADYLALGDIHEPQQIPGLPAYYPGSVYPASWGETHKAGCNLVEVDTGVPLHVSRIPFPHAVRSKISLKAADPFPATASGLVWVEITATNEEALSLDVDELTARLIGHGAIPGSQVTINRLPTETVRAAEITEKKALAEKVRIWGDASSIDIPESVLQKARDIERDAAAAGSAGQGAIIQLDRLILRGAIGIWKKSRKDEIDLDLEALGGGVIAFASPNGAGKTTILENLHPWPCMLTRDGTLKDHFRLRDSCRDLYFTDERTGFRYRSLINIRADIASGAAEYFLYRDTGAGFVPVEGIEGRKDAYETAIGDLFGSLSMFLQTAFVTQRASKYALDLSKATQGERKLMFTELAGIDYLSEFAKTCKARGDEIAAASIRLDATIAAAADVDETISRLSAESADQDRIAGSAEALARMLVTRGQALKAERDTIAQRVSELDRRAARADQIKAEVAQLSKEVEAAMNDIAGFRLATDQRAAAADELRKIEALEKRRAELAAEKAEIDRKNHEALVEHQKILDDLNAKQRAAQASLDAARRRKADAEREAAVARAKLAAPIADHCPTCAQLLPEEKRAHLQAERAKLEAEIARLAEVVNAATTDEMNADLALGRIVAPDAPSAAPFELAAELSAIDSDLAFLDADAALAIIRKADEAAVRIEGAASLIAEKDARKASLAAEENTMAADLLESLFAERKRLEEKDAELDAARAEYTAATNESAAARARADAARGSISDAEKRRAARDAALEDRDAKAAELADWRLLEKACGPNGIQALELDALAPSIAAVSNQILSGAFGSRYQIEFRTTRIAGKGSKTKQVEDFEIYIMDTETGDEQTIDSLSGGEAVWIKKALYDGFAIIRAKNSGTKFLTAFLDEADGALDPEARMQYLRMLEAAHRESGRFQTILVTHSSELQAMVGMVIDVAKLEGRKSEAVAA